MSIFGDFWDLVTEQINEDSRRRAVIAQMNAAANQTELDAIFSSLSKEDQQLGIFAQTYNSRKGATAALKEIENPLTDLIEGFLDEWTEAVEKYDMKDPAKAKETLAGLTADVLRISGGALAVELALGALPNTQGTVAKMKISELMAWLGFGAVVSAVAHDPVKIGLLRPYQDQLEATFRNRRPGDIALFQAYRTRELSPIKVDDLNKLTDAEMTRIEKDNEDVYFREISKWGYSEWFATALSRSATRTLSFSQLVTLARAGIYDKGLSIYSLWGEGLDRVVMPAAISALETLRDREMYSGFRSLVEPSYVEGDISEAELREYWDLSGVPKKVQDWVVTRLSKRRAAFAQKAAGRAITNERDLTVSQLQSAYIEGVMTRNEAQKAILDIGYSEAEKEILLKLAEARKKAPSSTTQKRLPLSDYEKAYKAKLIKIENVLDRMKGEYAEYDIELERQLLAAGKA